MGVITMAVTEPEIHPFHREPIESSDPNSEFAQERLSYPVSTLGTFEHKLFIDHVRRDTRSRLLIISPWVSGAVVTPRFIDDLSRLARRGVLIRIGFGIDLELSRERRDREAERLLMNLNERFENVVVGRLGNTHAKVLISDYQMVISSFNWLSFRGDPRSTFRQEEGILTSIKPVIDSSFDKYSKQIHAVSSADRMSLQSEPRKVGSDD